MAQKASTTPNTTETPSQTSYKLRMCVQRRWSTRVLLHSPVVISPPFHLLYRRLHRPRKPAPTRPSQTNDERAPHLDLVTHFGRKPTKMYCLFVSRLDGTLNTIIRTVQGRREGVTKDVPYPSDNPESKHSKRRHTTRCLACRCRPKP